MKKSNKVLSNILLIMLVCVLTSVAVDCFNGSKKVFASTLPNTVLTIASEDISFLPKVYKNSEWIFSKTDVVAPEHTTATGIVNVNNENYVDAGFPLLDVTLQADEGYIFDGGLTTKAFRATAQILKKELNFSATDIAINSKQFNGEEQTFAVEDVVAPAHTQVTAVSKIEGENYTNFGTPKINVQLKIIGSNHTFVIDGQDKTEKNFVVQVEIEEQTIDLNKLNFSTTVVYTGFTFTPTSTWFDKVLNNATITSIGEATKLGNVCAIQNSGTYKVPLTLTANSNFKFSNGNSVALIEATIIVEKAKLTVTPTTDYAYSTGKLSVEKVFNNNTSFNSIINLNTHYLINLNSTAFAPQLNYTGVFATKDAQNTKLTLSFSIKTSDLANYEFESEKNVIEINGKITPAPAKIFFEKNAYSHTYNSAVDEPSATTEPTGLEVVFTYSSSDYAPSTTAPTKPGVYTITATVDGNYSASNSTTYTINKLAPSVSGLTMTNKTVIYNNSPFSIKVDGTMPSYINTTFEYQKKLSLNSYAEATSTPPTLPGEYKITATFNVVENDFYKDFSEQKPTLTANLIILAVALQSNGETYGEVQSEIGINPNASFIIEKIDNGTNIFTVPMGYTLGETYSAKLMLNNEASVLDGQSIVIVELNKNVDRSTLKLFVYENQKVVQRSFILTGEKSIAFYSYGLGEFAIATLTNPYWWIWIVAGIIGALFVFIIICLIKMKIDSKKNKPKEEKESSSSSLKDEFNYDFLNIKDFNKKK